MKKRLLLVGMLATTILFSACEQTNDCTPKKELDTSRGSCTETLSYTPSYQESTTSTTRTITTNCIPNHAVGKFGSMQGSLNPNAISPQSRILRVDINPTAAASTTPLLGNTGPAYSFGVLLNGVEVDPIAAEPWPHTTPMDPNVNWEWNLEATNVSIGLDCNNAHVQPQGEYHYHGSPELYINSINPSSTTMTLIGWAADGFPIYYKYAYSDAQNSSSTVIEMTSGYSLKSGERPGDGIAAPCGAYNGIYSNDYEYSSSQGTLDECNGRTGVTPEFPGGTYYYVLTSTFPYIPRCFKGTPSADFQI